MQKLNEINFEVYQNEDKSIYTYLRSQRGYGNECNMLAFPIDSEPSIAMALTFLDLWSKIKPKWLAKDVAILFYNEKDYGISVKKFLNNYYRRSQDLK